MRLLLVTAIVALATASATSVGSQASRASLALWTVTRTTSEGHAPIVERVCLNDTAPPPELQTCAGSIKAPEAQPGKTVAVTCTTRLRPGSIKETMSEFTSDNWRVIRDRAERMDDVRDWPRGIPKPPKTSWSQSTMTYSGACPVPLKPEQPFVIIKPDGTVVDPFQATACMVGVLKTVEGVTEPSAGYFRDSKSGPMPFVRYTYPSRHGDKVAITFHANGDLADPVKWGFMTAMSGLFSLSDAGPDTFGADKITKLWRDRCGVRADILFT